MDTSEQYINMCRKAKELQEMWKPEPGDFYKLPGHFITCIVLKNSLIDVNATWLPRIDQWITIHLNRTWGETQIDTCIYLFREENFIHENYASPEQYMLTTWYYNSFQKIWNGEDWI